ncbi:unnamed protein product, partial [Phaeothamnion confervicola]
EPKPATDVVAAQEKALEPKAVPAKAAVPAAAMAAPAEAVAVAPAKVTAPAKAKEPEKPAEPKPDPAALAMAAAAEAVASGKRGKELKTLVAGMIPKPTARALLVAALEGCEIIQDANFTKDDALGPALKALAGSSTKEQTGLLYGAQELAHARGFPKYGAKGDNVLQTMFMWLYHGEVCEDEAYEAWKDDLADKTPGKTTAIVQTLKWFEWLETVEEEDDDEEDDEDA